MTSVIGVECEGRVWLGCDSSCLDSDGDGIITQRGSKVFRRGPYVVGFAGSFQVGDLLRYKVKFPEKPQPRLISEAIQAAFKTAELTTDDWEALVGADDGKLYVVQNDFYCYRHSRPYAAIGAGAAISAALGTLSTIEKVYPKMSGKARVKLALENAEAFSSNVRRPWRYTYTKPSPK